MEKPKKDNILSSKKACFKPYLVSLMKDGEVDKGNGKPLKVFSAITNQNSDRLNKAVSIPGFPYKKYLGLFSEDCKHTPTILYVSSIDLFEFANKSRAIYIQLKGLALSNQTGEMLGRGKKNMLIISLGKNNTLRISVNSLYSLSTFKQLFAIHILRKLLPVIKKISPGFNLSGFQDTTLLNMKSRKANALKVLNLSNVAIDSLYIYKANHELHDTFLVNNKGIDHNIESWDYAGNYKNESIELSIKNQKSLIRRNILERIRKRDLKGAGFWFLNKKKFPKSINRILFKMPILSAEAATALELSLSLYGPDITRELLSRMYDSFLKHGFCSFIYRCALEDSHIMLKRWSRRGVVCDYTYPLGKESLGKRATNNIKKYMDPKNEKLKVVTTNPFSYVILNAKRFTPSALDELFFFTGEVEEYTRDTIRAEIILGEVLLGNRLKFREGNGKIKSIFEYHDVLSDKLNSQEIMILRNEKKGLMLLNKVPFPEGFNLEKDFQDDLILREVKNAKELVAIGGNMRNCVGSYTEPYIRGEIFFMVLCKRDETGNYIACFSFELRKNKELEINKLKLIEAKLMHNKSIKNNIALNNLMYNHLVRNGVIIEASEDFSTP